MYLATRAHWEMTGLAAHVLTALRRFYGAGISEAELERTLKRLALGRRWDLPADITEDVAAINALTLVESAAKLLGREDVEHFVQDCYAFVSEHCHPNLFRRLAGVTLLDGGRIEFEAAFAVAELDLSACLARGIPSQRIFLHGYDECFRLLYQNEDMPSIEN
jgi:hypothetical protein